MEIKLIDSVCQSEWLDKVIVLGDSSRNTLGFLPRQAFADYAKKNRILIATQEDILAGYLLFRWNDRKIVIVHLCIHPSYRNLGIAKALVEHLHLDNKEYYSTMCLSCRRDYDLDDFWHSLGFMPIAEKPGRASKGPTILTTWVRKNPDIIDLFSTDPSLIEPQKRAVLDTNIVIDLCSKTNAETLLLEQPFMRDSLEYYVTDDTLTEINRRDDPASRNRYRDYAKEHFKSLETVDQAVYSKVCQDLYTIKPVKKSSNTGYDISHIAYAVASGCQIFVTRDAEWLDTTISEHIFDRYGLSIQSPGQLVKTIDEISSPTAYAPLNLAGLNLQYSEIQAMDLKSVCDTLHQYGGMKKTQFRAMLQSWMAYPDKYRIVVMKSMDTPISLLAHTTGDDTMYVISFIINEKFIKPSLQGTLIKRIAFKLIEDAKNSHISKILIEKTILSENIRDALRGSLFLETETALVRYIVARSVEKSELGTLAHEQEVVEPINELIMRCGDIKMPAYITINDSVQLEKALWPLKIRGVSIPCYIVPIRASYAQALFDEDLANTNISLFSNEQIEPALSIENIYYKSSKKSIPTYPARILWYVSYDKKLMGSKMIRACSYLDGVETGTVKGLYQKYRRLGVLSWRDMKCIAHPSEFISVYKFSYTEQFSNPIPYNKIAELLGKKHTFQSFVEITPRMFDEIYEIGCRGLQNE